MKMKRRYFYLGSVVALSLLFAAGPGFASPDKAKQKASAPERPKAMPEVVLMREQVRPHGESAQSKKIRGANKHPGKKSFRAERGLRAENPELTRNRMVVVPGEFTQIVEVRAVPPGKGKPKGDDKSAKPAP